MEQYCESISQAQLDAHWMAFSSNRQFKKNPRLIVKSEGRYYTTAEGRKVFDSLSGLWTCGLGHNHPFIIESVKQQLDQLDYAPAFQFGHFKAFQLAERITEFMPKGLGHVFFTCSGSESVDTALKMARAYWHKKGHASKTKFIGRKHMQQGARSR